MSKADLTSHAIRKCDQAAAEKLACEHCGAAFSDRRRLTQHISKRHRPKATKPKATEPKATKPKPEPDALMCEHCGANFSSSKRLNLHIRRRHGPKESLGVHECEVCGEHLRRREEIEHHRALHVTHWPFKCDICHRRFKSRKDVARHKARTHTDDTVFDFLSSP